MPGVRFAGVVNKMGRLAAGRFRSGITSHMDDKEDRTAYMQFALEVFMSRDFDEKLGEVEYMVTRRKKVTVVCMPAGDHVALISAEPDIDVPAVIKAARGAFGGAAGARA